MHNEIPETDEDDLRKRPDNEEEAFLQGRHAFRPSTLGKIDRRHLVNGPYKGAAEVSEAMVVAAKTFEELLSHGNRRELLRKANISGMDRPTHPLAEQAYDLGIGILQSVTRIVEGKPIGQGRVNWLYNIHKRFDMLSKAIDQKLLFSDAVERAMLVDVEQGLQLLQDMVKKSGLQEAMPSPSPEVTARS